MEYLIASLALLGAAGYAVFIAVNIEKGKPWALEIARAVSMLDPNLFDPDMHCGPRSERPRTQEQPPETESPRLAA